MKKVILFQLVMLQAFGQAVLIQPNNSSASIEMNSGTGGLSPSKVALVAKNLPDPLVGVQQGLLVFNTTTNSQLQPGYFYWSGSNWTRLSDSDIEGVPVGGIIEKEQKADIPGYTYVGYKYHGDTYYQSLGQGFGSWPVLPAYPHNGNVIEPTGLFFQNNFFVWSGQDNSYASYDQTGAFYNTTSNTWTSMSTVNAPVGRWGNVTVVDPANAFMYIWGGVTSMTGAGSIPVVTNTGGRYDVLYPTSPWFSSFPNGPLTARYRHVGVFGNQSMIIWGGSDAAGNAFGDGAAYSVGFNNWSTIAPSPLAPRYGHTAVFTDSRMIIYGGTDGAQNFNDGASYNPFTDTWTMIANGPSNMKVFDHVAVWTGTEMIIFGGNTTVTPGTATNQTSRYNPTTDTWSTGALAPGGYLTASAYYGQKAIWTGTEMVVAGGKNSYANSSRVVRAYNPSTNSWSLFNQIPASIIKPAMVWDGSKILLQSGSWYSSSGYAFGPATGTPSYVEVPAQKFFYKYRKD